jgi:predicted  nucleic acid-binding Zn-ribbon protein
MFGMPDMKSVNTVADKGMKVLRDIDNNLGAIQRNFQEVVARFESVEKELKLQSAELAEIKKQVQKDGN